jgi:hypothetical protein
VENAGAYTRVARMMREMKRRFALEEANRPEMEGRHGAGLGQHKGDNPCGCPNHRGIQNSGSALCRCSRRSSTFTERGSRSEHRRSPRLNAGRPVSFQRVPVTPEYGQIKISTGSPQSALPSHPARCAAVVAEQETRGGQLSRGRTNGTPTRSDSRTTLKQLHFSVSPRFGRRRITAARRW